MGGATTLPPLAVFLVLELLVLVLSAMLQGRHQQEESQVGAERRDESPLISLLHAAAGGGSNSGAGALARLNFGLRLAAAALSLLQDVVWFIFVLLSTASLRQV